MNILITGSRGMIGKRLVNVLRAQNHNIKEFDLALGNDITQLQDCLTACKGIDLIIHCAACLDEDNGKLFEINVQGTKNILESAARNGVQRVIHISSVGVYGNAETQLSETAKRKPFTKYEQSKAQAEEIVEEYQEMVSVTVLRPAMVVGINNYWEEIIKKIKSGMPLVGNGNNQWQVVQVDDVVSAIVFCVNHEEETAGEIFNVAEERASTLNELVESVKNELGMRSGIKHIPVWLGRLLGILNGMVCLFTRKPNILSGTSIERIIRSRWYSIDKLKKLGWRPRYDMKASMKWIVKEIRVKNN